MDSWARRKSRGSLLVIFAIVLIVLFALFVVIPVFYAMRRASPAVKDAYWTVGTAHVVQVLRGEQVVAHVKVKATEDYAGSIVVKVRKDVAWWADSDYEVSTFPVDLEAGEETALAVAFVPDESSGSSFRGYFIQVEFPNTRGSWTMANSYPPRLRVID